MATKLAHENEKRDNEISNLELKISNRLNLHSHWNFDQMTTKLERLIQQREQLDKAIQEAARIQNAKDRAADKQRKIIFGAWCMANRPDLLREFIANGLARPQDKAAFAGWIPPEPEKKSAALAPALAAAPQPKTEG
jgi:hypothetical protein